MLLFLLGLLERSQLLLLRLLLLLSLMLSRALVFLLLLARCIPTQTRSAGDVVGECDAVNELHLRLQRCMLEQNRTQQPTQILQIVAKPSVIRMR